MEPARAIVLRGLEDVVGIRLGDILEPESQGPDQSVPLGLGTRRQRAEIVQLLLDDPDEQRAIAQLMSARFRRRVLGQYQFVELGAREDAALLQVYQQLVADVVEHLASEEAWARVEPRVRATVRNHRVRLRDLVAGLLGEPDREFVAAGGFVVCREYAPGLQLRVLGVAEGQLRDPILDLGCGEDAALVHWLRDRGHVVTGVDRLVEPGRDLIRSSWFELELEPNRWGSVVSHQSFSLHFVHAHLRPGSWGERFARKYREILDSIRPGGTFYYAPGLPFVEGFLDHRRYSVRRTPIPEPGDLDMPDPLRQVYGAEGMYAAAVSRST